MSIIVLSFGVMRLVFVSTVVLKLGVVDVETIFEDWLGASVG